MRRLTLQRLPGVFEVRTYPAEYSVKSLMRRSLPDPIDNAAGRVQAVRGVRSAVDMVKLQQAIGNIDRRAAHARRRKFDRIWHEARLSEEPGLGISFTSMLFLLAHHKLIDDEKALQ